ncbi:traB domain-containing protein [Eupeodes corollae]|uniref:traB domain-containing protein n=1 Tax=Eupeodes corollae TaxID=290404 RepID=UPI002492945C|nr:traB domain-containing protein [Eupeodes corollae]
MSRNMSKMSVHNETDDSSSLYSGVLENLPSYTSYSSFNESANNNRTNNSSINNSTDLDIALSNSDTPFSKSIDAKNASYKLIQSESTDNSEEVDPKSQLANKTIFKTDNPNLSIIEISDSSTLENENSVYVVESSSDEGEGGGGGGGGGGGVGGGGGSNNDISSEKRRKKVESLLHSSKQRLNISPEPSSTTAATSPLSPISPANPQSSASPSKTLENGNNPPKNRVDAKKRESIHVFDDIDEFEKHLPHTVTVLTTPFGSKVYLVGTAHFSEESQDDVSYVIRNVRPDVVMVELCPSRIHILKLDEKTLLEEAKNFNIAKIRSIFQTNGYINGIFFILLLHMSAQLAKELGMAPGGEFRRAFEEIHKIPGCVLHLGDRPIRITLQRALRALSFRQTLKLVWRLTSSETISIEEVEECKQRDLLEKLMQEMAGEFPAFSDVFVKERDLFLCHSLQVAALPIPQADGTSRPVSVVGVVGIGHANGIAENWGKVNPSQIQPILEIPPASLGTRVAKYTIKYGLISLTLYGAFKFLRPRVQRLF